METPGLDELGGGQKRGRCSQHVAETFSAPPPHPAGRSTGLPAPVQRQHAGCPVQCAPAAPAEMRRQSAPGKRRGPGLRDPPSDSRAAGGARFPGHTTWSAASSLAHLPVSGAVVSLNLLQIKMFSSAACQCYAHRLFVEHLLCVKQRQHRTVYHSLSTGVPGRL